MSEVKNLFEKIKKDDIIFALKQLENKYIPFIQQADRKENMGGGRLRLLRDNEGDLTVAIISDKGESLSVEFTVNCQTSPNTILALQILMVAMEEDSQNDQ